MISTLSKITKRLDLAKEQLGVIPASKGLVFGAIGIDNDISDIQESYIDQYLADSAHLALQGKKILIVEKHSVFDNIVRASLVNFDDIVMVTGRGFPDCATQRFLSRIRDLSEDTEYFYLGDYDPHGLQICLTYRKILPQLIWMGISLAQIMHFEVFDGQMPLTEKDARLLSNIILRADDEYQLAVEACHQQSIGIVLREAEQMIERRVKCEIEAFDNHALGQIISFL